MYKSKLRLKKSFYAVAATLAPCLALPTIAMAQSTDSTAAKTERVEITGSSIKRIDAETALPVQILKREDIERTGATSTEDLVKQISAFSSSGSISTAASAGTQTGSISSISLRGLSSSRTLVLVNGRRASVYGGGSAGAAGSAVDINSIPLSAIERVEILKDGASAIYGSDAIAGVVNFILRKDFKNIEATVSYGQPGAGMHGADQKISLFGGIGTIAEQGFNVTYGANIHTTSAIYGSERPFASRINLEQQNDYLSNITFPANVLIPKSKALRNPNLSDCGPVSQVSPFSPTRCSFDNSPFVSILPGSQHINLLLNGRLALSNGSEAYFESGYSQSKTMTAIQPVPLNFNNNLPANNPYNAYFTNLLATQYPTLDRKVFGVPFPGAFLLPPSSPYYPTAFAAAKKDIYRESPHIGADKVSFADAFALAPEVTNEIKPESPVF